MVKSIVSNSNIKLGIIGFGKMAQAIYKGLQNPPKSCHIYDPNPKVQALIEADKTLEKASISTLYNRCDLILIAIKPQQLATLFEDLPKSNSPIIVSILAGIPCKTFEDHFSTPTPIIRVMPNTPIQVQAGCSIYAPNKACSKNDIALCCELFQHSSHVYKLEENNFDAITALCGSSPAFFYRIILEMAKAAS
eukprot:COSAG02_NODE_21601_length_782_cov_0.606149_2_plen_192_part_01